MNDHMENTPDPEGPTPGTVLPGALSRRSFLGLGASVALGATVLGAAKPLNRDFNFTNSSNSKVTLTFWNSFTASDKPFVEAIVAKYNATQDKVFINMTIMPGDVLQEKLEVSLGTGTGPDIPQAPGGPVQAIAQFANAEVIQPVDFVYGADGVDRAVLPPG